MRIKTLLTSALFAKENEVLTPVALPHTWNALDGQDGGADYWRGIGTYELKLPDPTKGKKQYIEFLGANHVATVYCNGRELGTHKGGFSTFRFDLTPAMKAEGNVLTVVVTNGVSDIYPQNADFTFYGGLYRDVNIICVSQSHFDLDYYGAPGIKVTPVMDGNNANVEVEAFVTNPKAGQEISYTINDQEGNMVAQTISADTKACFTIENVHKWHGCKDPYLYGVQAALLENMYTLWFSHPNMEQIIYWNLVDGYAHVWDPDPEKIRAAAQTPRHSLIFGSRTISRS